MFLFLLRFGLILALLFTDLCPSQQILVIHYYNNNMFIILCLINWCKQLANWRKIYLIDWLIDCLIDWNFEICPRKFQRKQAFTNENSAKLCDNPWKFQRSKTLKFPHAPSFSVLEYPWLAGAASWKIQYIASYLPYVSLTHPLFGFFFIWNSPIRS